jgi:hypothetical protein
MLTKHSIINLLHVLVFVPFFYYLYTNIKTVSPKICYGLIGVVVMAFMYHAFYLSKNLSAYQNMVYLIHLLLVFPVLFIIGYKCNETPRYIMEALLLLTFAALGYHSYNFIKYN